MRLSLLSAAFLLSSLGCGIPYGDIEVVPADVYDEVEPNDDSSDPEETGITLDGETWFELRGTFDSVDDNDYYRIDIGNRDRVDLVTWREYRGEPQQYNLAFPINVNEYSEDGSLGMQNLLAAWSWGVDFEPEAAWVVLKVYGQTEEAAGVDSYRDGRPYVIQLR